MATSMASLPMRAPGAMADPHVDGDPGQDDGTYSCVAVCMDAASGKFLVMSIPAPDEQAMDQAQSFDNADAAFMAAQDLLKGPSADPMAGTSPDDAMADGYAGAKGDPVALSNNARKYGGM